MADRVFGPYPDPIFVHHHDRKRDADGHDFIAVLTRNGKGVQVFRHERRPDDTYGSPVMVLNPPPHEGYGAPVLTIEELPDGGCILSVVGKDENIRYWRLREFVRFM